MLTSLPRGEEKEIHLSCSKGKIKGKIEGEMGEETIMIERKKIVCC
jgi:hypothetical protein